MQSTDGRTRKAVDNLFARIGSMSHGPETAKDS